MMRKLPNTLAIFFVSTCFSMIFALSSGANAQQTQRESYAKVSIADRFVRRAESLFRSGVSIADKGSNSDDAYTLFRAAQIIEPDNQRAQAGLDAILIAELDTVRNLLASGKLRAAESKLASLDSLFPKSRLVENMKQSLRESAQRRAAQNAARRQSAKKSELTSTTDAEKILLDEQELNRKSEQLVATLQDIAKTVESSNQGVVIYARSDAQARWVYQQMRKAVVGYRIRGDLKIGRPAITLLPPFD